MARLLLAFVSFLFLTFSGVAFAGHSVGNWYYASPAEANAACMVAEQPHGYGCGLGPVGSHPSCAGNTYTTSYYTAWGGIGYWWGCNSGTTCQYGLNESGACNSPPPPPGPPLAQLQPDKELPCNNSAEGNRGNPCNASNGNKYQTESDYVGGDGVPSITRHYNCLLEGKDYGLGFGWTWMAVRKLEIYGTLIQVREGDGRGEPFTKNASGQWVPDADSKLSLTQDASGYVLTRQDGSVERYDTNGRLASETDRNGRTTTYTYNSAGKLASVTGPFGHVLAIGYDGNGRIGSITDPAGVVYGYAYDTQGNLNRVTYPDGTFRLYHYENTSFPHHLTGITDERGLRFSTYAYDTSGKAIRTEHAITTNASPQERFSFTYNSDVQTTVTDPIGTQEVMGFSANLGVKNLTTKTNQGDGKVLTQTFNTHNNLTCKKDEEGRVTTYTYNATNQRLTTTEGQGGDCTTPASTPVTRTITYQYVSSALALPTVIESPSVAGGQTKKTEIAYTHNLPTTITQRGYTPSSNSISRTINLQYDSQGRVTSIDGPRTDTTDITALEYNNCASGSGCGQLKTITNAIGQVTTFNTYDAHGRLIESTDPNGLKTGYSYDLRGRVLSVTQTPPATSGGSPRITQYQYDPRGNVINTTQPDGRALTYIYDAANYLTAVTDNLNNRVEYSYDLKGNRTTSLTKDPDGSLVRSIQTAYDIRNRAAQINHAGSLTSQVFDALGNLTNTQDPNGNPTTNQYDSLNRLLQTVDALSGTTSYGYDKNDKLTQVTAPNGANTGYEQDDLGNQLKETSPDRGTLTYTHDDAGNVKSVTDARNVTATYSYDALNRVSSMDYPGTEEDVALTYDSYTSCTNGLGRLCKTQDQSGTTEYAYDPFGNLAETRKTERGVTYTTRYTHDTLNRVAAITYPDGRTLTYTRDTVGWVTAVNMTLNGTTTTLANTITYRADGLPKSIAYGNGLTEQRTYNLKGELTDQTLGSETRNYTYDLSGNLTQAIRASGTSLYGYDTLDRLLSETSASVGSLAYSYDANGNRLSLIDNGQTKPYGYSPNTNRLTHAANDPIVLDPAGNTLSDTNGIRSFSYYASGRLQQIKRHGRKLGTYVYDYRGLRTQKLQGGPDTLYHYDQAGRLLGESDTKGVFQTLYVWLNDQPLAQIDTGRTTTLTYLHADSLGTPRLATDANQQVVWRWDGNAFGDTLR
jgi:YD repeat-containing protein